MNIPTTDQTKAFHVRWQQLTGIELAYDFSRHFAWEQWIGKGLTITDLEIIVTYIKKRIRQGRREKESLMFRNMVNNVDNALEDLSIARAETRNERKETPRERILSSVGMSKPQPERVQPVGDIMAGSSAFEKFREAMKAEGLL